MSRGRSRRRKKRNGFKKYMRRTYKNKLCAIALFITGLFCAYVLQEASALLFISIIAIPLFFTRENWITE